MRLACAAVIIEEPIEIHDGTTFTVRGRLQTSSAVLGDLPMIRGTGEISGSRVSLPVGPGGSPAVLNLEAGVRPLPVDLPTCPQ